MATKKKARLGRGLGALLGEVRPEESSAAAGIQLRQLPIEQLQRGKFQPRVAMAQSALEELAESIRVQGVIQPLLVRQIPNSSGERYEIIAGERRWRGAQLAGLARVPVVVKEVSDQNAMAVALIENIQREDLNAIETAAGFQRLLKEFSLTHQEIAEAVGCSRAAVSNLLRLLTLHPTVKKLLEEGQIDMGHGRTLLGLPSEKQPGAANKVIVGGLSVRRTEQLVKQLLAGGKKAGATPKNPDVLQLEESLSTRIGARVSIQHGDKKGKLIIHYHSLDELDGILERIK